MNNKKLIALGMLLIVRGAFAQSAGSSVEIYGTMDIGVGHSQHSLSEDSNFPINMNPVATKFGDKADTGMFNGGESPSRIGFKGSEDLGSGLKAIFTLETGFNSPNGVIANGPASLANNPTKNAAGVAVPQTTVNADSSLAGQLFNRQAFVGLSSSELGTFTAGRNYSLGYDTLLAYDPMEGSQTFSPFGYSGSYAGGGFTEDFRIDNSLKYKFASNGINFGALYKLGGQAGATDAQSEVQLNLGYENGPFGIQGTYSSVKDGISATNSAIPGEVAISVADTKAYMLAASFKMNQLRLRGGYERIEVNNPSNPSNDLGIGNVLGYNVSAVNVNAFATQKTLNVYFAGLTFDVTPAFSGTFAFYDVKQNDYTTGVDTCPNATASTCSGSSKFYSVMGKYKLSKRTDVYAGYMYNKVDGGMAAGFLHDNNGFFGTGIKHSF